MPFDPIGLAATLVAAMLLVVGLFAIIGLCHRFKRGAPAMAGLVFSLSALIMTGFITAAHLAA